MDTARGNGRAGRSPLATALALLALVVQLLTPMALAAPRSGDAFAASLVICGQHGAQPVLPGAGGAPADDGKAVPQAHDCLLCCARFAAAFLPPAAGAVGFPVGWIRLAAPRPAAQMARVAVGLNATSPRGPPAV